MPAVTYDKKSFIVDSERVWLVSGEIHYFRIPRGLWRDRLLKAKRAGLNCISTYVAWNYHEPIEGQWELTGEKDIKAFINMAGELGLYVILRPGPYICAEWDFGGLPAWLNTKTGISLRTNNAAYTHYYDKFFKRILPDLSKLQVSCGGNIILIQNENEYIMTTMPDRISYLDFISKLFRRAGFDIPIITCNHLYKPAVPGAIECLNTWENADEEVKKLALLKEKTPLLFTEFWCGWFDHWGGEHHRRPAKEVTRRSLEILGMGGQFNYYMWHGGTNFGFMGSHQAEYADQYMTTSYDFDAPLAEGGGMGQKYYLTRLVNTLCGTMGKFFAPCRSGSFGTTICNSPSVHNLTSPTGGWAVISNGGCDMDTAEVSLPSGVKITVSTKALGGAVIPVNLVLSRGITLNWTNVTPLGWFDDKTLVLHGPAGWEAKISIDGKIFTQTIPADDNPELMEYEHLKIVIVNTDLAMRTWHVDNTLIFGPLFVAEDERDIVVPQEMQRYSVLTPDGIISKRKVKKPAGKKASAPRIGKWKKKYVCPEPLSLEKTSRKSRASKNPLRWKKSERPRDLDKLGLHYGYAWYRMITDELKNSKVKLFLPHCADRATIFQDGKMIGIWGNGDDATKKPIPATLLQGQNTFVFLLDNLGRYNFDIARMGEKKGLFGPVYDAKPMAVKFKIKRANDFPRKIIPRHLSFLCEKLEKLPLWIAKADIRPRQGGAVSLNFSDIPHDVAVLCNGRPVGVFPLAKSNWADIVLDREIKKSKNTLEILLWGDVNRSCLENITLHDLGQPIGRKIAWSTRAWNPPENENTITGKNLPAWFAANFRKPENDESVFLKISGAKKGQIYLNRNNVGRFWNAGPQTRYYLPSTMLLDKNEILLFSENGISPATSRLEILPAGPFADGK